MKGKSGVVYFRRVKGGVCGEGRVEGVWKGVIEPYPFQLTVVGKDVTTEVL